MAGLMDYVPLNMRCDTCAAMPGMACRSVVIPSRPLLRRPHAPRVTAARTASQHRERSSSMTSEAWTCAHCGRSYWPPKEWEPQLWPIVRRAAQELHRDLHT